MSEQVYVVTDLPKASRFSLPKKVIITVAALAVGAVVVNQLQKGSDSSEEIVTETETA
jgi:hypothetical protein